MTDTIFKINLPIPRDALSDMHNGEDGDYNDLIHLADMPRKPSPKVALAWADLIAAETDRIAAIALASNKPDWKQIAALFANVTA